MHILAPHSLTHSLFHSLTHNLTFAQCNKAVRQKGWKLSNTDAISKLKHDYIKYYKSKGCNSVQFYYNNTLIRDETKSLRELGVSNGGMIYAMENGKAYTQL